MSTFSKAVFLSYASQDAQMAKNVAAALRTAGIEVWFDQTELRGGEVWDARIRQQIKACALFMPLISQHTQQRLEGYFRLEWHLAERRMQHMHEDAPFLLPVAIDAAVEDTPRVPERFLDVQWVRLAGGEVTAALASRVAAMLRPEAASVAAGVPLRPVQGPEPCRAAAGRSEPGSAQLRAAANTGNVQRLTFNAQRTSAREKREGQNFSVKRSALNVEPAKGRASACSPSASSGAASAGRVLIVEDDPTMQRVLKDNFEFRGYEVRVAPDGRQALDLVSTFHPDLIVLDIMLPGVNGFDVCRRIRGEGLATPIIMLTAKSQESDIVLGLNLGADDYVAKPFSIEVLLARATACLRRRQEPARTAFEFGECQLDHESHKLFRRGAGVALTPKEFGVLEYFVRNAGRALTREKILDAVWGDDLIVTDRSVDRCINTLRNKIEPNPDRPRHIQTIRDVGYRFEAG